MTSLRIHALEGKIDKIAKEAIKVLSPRTRDIVSRRFGLRGKRQTLESIGRKYGITRERVRQIEADGLRALSRPEAISIFTPVIDFLKQYAIISGHVISEKRLLSGVFKLLQSANVSLLALTLSDQFERFKETPKLNAVWVSNVSAWNRAQKLIGALENCLKSGEGPVSLDKISKFLKSQNDAVSSGVIASYLSVSKDITQNKFGQWGMKSWPEITPKGVKDKAYLVLKRKGNPQHFRNISGLIDRAGFSSKSTHVQTVHNELIKDPRFILVGRGTYALTEWGYEPGTVRDVIVSVLKRNSSPIPKETIIKRVLNERGVKANTVVINLQNSKFFKKSGKGYTLV